MAKANTTDEVCEWQLTKNTMSQRIKHLYRNPLMADVHFLVADKRERSDRKVVIPCHKFVLAVSSPVFFEMFYGKLQDPSEYIDLPDCDSEGFLEFLRYIYCEKIKVRKHRQASCVIMKVLYLAKKYMIPSLTTQCRCFLEANINAENVMDVLPVMHKLEETHLFDACCKLVDAHTEEVFRTTPNFFPEYEEPLVSMLRRDTLEVKEVDVFQAVNRWAEGICKRRGLTPSGKEKRTIIGDTILKLVRFPLMSQKVFAEQVPDTGILSETEIRQIFMYFALNRKPGEFSTIPRCLNKRTIRRCRRFAAVGSFWQYNRGVCDIIWFTVNIPIVLRGIRLFGCKGEEYYVKLKLWGNTVLEDRFLSKESDGYYGFDLIFEQWYQLNADVPCILEALIKGPKSSYGVSCKEEVVCENATFRFFEVDLATSSTTNGSTVRQGQFAEIIFADI